MNASNARDYLPLVQALADGKVVQFKAQFSGWTDTTFINSDQPAHRYRIKPEPREIWVVDGEENLAYFDKDSAYATGGVVVRYREVIE